VETVNIVVLSIAGLLQLFVGASRLIKPVKTFAEKTGIALGDDVNLLSEARGIGGLMMLGGMTMLLGAALPQLRLTSLIVATVIFAGFALGRALGMVLDGRPNKLLVQGLVFELVFASLAAFGALSSLM
jgi:hypothetical protein